MSVIVAVRDGEHALPALFDALDAQSLGRDAFDVVVIDNASRDRTSDVARARGATIVSEPVPGRARARNRGIAETSAGVLAFTDADCRPRPQWLAALVPRLEAGEPLVAGRTVVTTGSSPRAAERLDALWRFKERDDAGWAATANLGMRRDAFEAIGGFDPAYRHIGEDVDLCLRARAAGYPLSWCDEAIVEHPAETELWGMLRRSFEQACSQDMLHRRHGLKPARHWRNPGPLVRGDWALRRFGIDPSIIPRSELRPVLRTARLEYAARIAGSLWAPVHRRVAS